MHAHVAHAVDILDVFFNFFLQVMHPNVGMHVSSTDFNMFQPFFSSSGVSKSPTDSSGPRKFTF